VLLQMVFLMLFPLVVAPTLLPLGIDVGLAELGWGVGMPICLVLSVAELVGIAYLYRALLGWQGNLLLAREQRILAVVATRADS